jgi:UDP-GlcNAc:undecaprenyl-phosphate GlcNAc-1-phosphate transferase
MIYNLIIIFILINIPFFFYHQKIAQIFNLLDKADHLRKLHSKSVPLTGGLIIFYNYIIFFVINFFYNLNISDSALVSGKREFFTLFIVPIFFYFFGYLDDKYNISANTKLVITSILLLFAMYLDDKFIIDKIYFSFLEFPVALFSLSFFATLLCSLLFINALNMFDGIDLQVGTYSIVILIIFISKSLFVNLSIVLILSILLFLYYNKNKKSFLGNSGVLFLGYLISYFFIKTSNVIPKSFMADEIFTIMLLPGLDLIRLFIYRICKGRHPFKADRNHLHHLLLVIFSEKKTYIILQMAIIFSIIGYYLFSFKIYYIIFVIFLYFFTIHSLVKK